MRRGVPRTRSPPSPSLVCGLQQTHHCGVQGPRPSPSLCRVPGSPCVTTWMVPLGDPAQACINAPRASARPIQGLVCGEKALVRAWAFTCRERGSRARPGRGPTGHTCQTQPPREVSLGTLSAMWRAEGTGPPCFGYLGGDNLHQATKTTPCS